MVDLNKLAGKMRERRITQKKMATALALSEQTISAKCTGKIRIYTDEAFLISQLLELSKEERLEIFFCSRVAQ